MVGMKGFMRTLFFLAAGSLPVDLWAAPSVVQQDAHVLWILISAILVIFMTIPGIATFYGGLVHRRNVLSIYSQCVAMASIASICWLLFGYSITYHFSEWHVWSLIEGWRDFPLSDIKRLVHLFYQMGFAMITVVIIIGGFAERMKFAAALMFTPIWLLLVYCPIAHWMWGGGWLQRLGAMDFAGGTVVHLNAGIAGLVAAIMVGERQFKRDNPHSLSIVTIGTSILWVGWFGFNSGGAETFRGTVLALLNTQFAPAASALTWMFVEWCHTKKPSMSGLLFGVISGLVAITPTAGYCSPYSALLLGVITAPICYLAVHMKRWVRYDDALDAFGIHGVAGIVGALFTGLLAAKGLGGTGVMANNVAMQLMVQVVAVAATLIWSGSWTFVILWLVNKVVGIRVPVQQEEEGLDIHQHGEGYEWVD